MPRKDMPGVSAAEASTPNASDPADDLDKSGSVAHTNSMLKRTKTLTARLSPLGQLARKSLRYLRAAVTPERPDPDTRFDATLFPVSSTHLDRDHSRPDTQAVSSAQTETKHINDPRVDLDELDTDQNKIIDNKPETLIDQRYTSSAPHPFGRLGKPFSRKSPLLIGFTAAIGVILAIVLALAIQQAKSVLTMIIIALFLAIGLNPLVEKLIHLGLRRSLSVLIVFLGLVSVFTGACFAIIPPVIEQTQVLWQRMPLLLENLQKSETIRNLNERYQMVDKAQQFFVNNNIVGQLTNQIFGWGRFFLGLIFTTITIFIMTLYFMSSLPVIKRHFYAMVPATRRTRVMLLSDEILLRIGGYVSGAFLVSVISGIACYIYLRVVGIDYALPLALAAALLSLIPMVGATVAGTVLSIVAFFYSIPMGIATIIYYVLYQQIENYIIYPKIMKRSIDVPPVITVVAALIGGSLLGFVGVLLAIPTAAAILLVVREVVIPRQDMS